MYEYKVIRISRSIGDDGYKEEGTDEFSKEINKAAEAGWRVINSLCDSYKSWLMVILEREKKQ